jgi:TolB-like protein/Flp pilus assembly protein TadD
VLRALNLAPADGPARPAVPTTAPSIAVLAFDDLSEKHDQGYFADGVAEEIINALAHVQGLKVIARTSSFSFKGKGEDLRRIGQQLDVAHVLEGSVRKSGGRVRVAAQLIRVSDGSHLWSEIYERPLADVFAVQDELARAVTRALGPRLVDAAPRSGRKTASPAAHDLYLRGLALWNLRTVEGLRRAADLFRQAIALDPGYALAHVGLANALAQTIQYAQANPHPLQEQAEAEARQALQLDLGMGEAHAALGSALSYAGDWAGARRALEEAVRLSPDDATAHQWLGENLLIRGEMTAGRAEVERARALDPASRIINTVVSWGAYLARDYPASELAARQALELAPDFAVARYLLAEALVLQGKAQQALVELARVDAHQAWSPDVAFVLARAGRGEEARRYAEEVEARARQMYVPPGFLAHTRAAVGQVDLAFEAFAEACRTRDVNWVHAALTDPRFDALRGDPRWKEVLACLKLA